MESYTASDEDENGQSRGDSPPPTQEVLQGADLDQNAPKTLTTDDEKSKALQDSHDAPLAGHFGVARTLAKLRRKYVWKGMTKDVKDYVHDCQYCNKAIARRHKPYGELHPLPPPSGPWKEVTMDFIPELPPSKMNGVVYNAILVVVCRLTKMAHYIPASTKWDGIDLANAWIREIVRLHGVPERVLSDRGPLMNANHWRTFNHYLNSKRVLTSTYHPETDGQTERQNQTLEQYLRIYCCVEQDDWAFWISLAEYAYNDSVHSVTGFTPFVSCYGFTPTGADFPDRPLDDGISPKGQAMASKLIEIQSECRRKIKAANVYQKQLQDRKRKPLLLSAGDKVYVSSRHIKSFRPKKKLDWKYFGPGTVIEKINDVAYRVDLPGTPNIHPVFHVSLLEPFVPKGSLQHPPGLPADTLQQVGDDIYEVEELIDRERDEDGNWKYLVKWKGYPPEENSWEPSANISGNALREYLDKHDINSRRRKRAKK